MLQPGFAWVGAGFHTGAWPAMLVADMEIGDHRRPQFLRIRSRLHFVQNDRKGVWVGFENASWTHTAGFAHRPREKCAYIFRNMETTATPSRQPLSAALIGTWELLTREDRTHAGEPRIDPTLGPNPVALLLFDQQGHFAAQFMKRDRGTTPETAAAVPAGAPNNSRARGGYDAYFGTYVVDEPAGTVATRLVGALSQENVGQVFVRHMSVAGDVLTIRLETASVEGERITRTLRWKRVG